MLHAVKNPRIETLRNRMFEEPRFMSIEQARIVTDTYRNNENLPRILQRARALRASLEQIEIAIEPEERIVGNRTAGVRAGVVFPESGAGWVGRELESLPTRPQDPFNVREEDARELRTSILPYWEGRALEDVLAERDGDLIDEIAPVVKINQKDHAQGHICPNCTLWLEKGPSGILEDVRGHAQSTQDEQAAQFYEAAAETLEGAAAFMRRYGELAAQMAATADDPEIKENLSEVSDICYAIAERPPRTFHEALQSLWFLFVVLQMESNASSFSPGRMDKYLWPFYEADIREGRMTRDEALELIECLWLKFNQIVYMRNQHSAEFFAGFPIGFNIAVGGVDENGEDYSNELSDLLLQAQYDLGLPQPNLSVRLHEGTNDRLLEEAIRVVARGSGMPQFFNDKAVISTLEELGIEQRDARDYAIVGCVELTTQGNNLGWSDSAMFNLNKILELTMTGGTDLVTGKQIAPDYGSLETYQSYDELEAAFAKYLDYYMQKMIAACEAVEKVHQELLPSPFLSTVISDCIEEGRDVTAGGAKYNLSGIQMIQVANLADSLAALRQLVYEEQRFTGGEVLEALRADFDGYDIMRSVMLNKVPKYGNDVRWVDELGAKWAAYFRDRLSQYTNYRGGPYHTGMYTVSAHVPMGRNVGASPDGRKSREPLADGGMSPVYGRDTTGPTAVLQSVARLDRRLTSNGGLLNMKFLPEFFATQAGIDRFGQFLRTFVDLEIPHIQFNVLNREDLLAAQRSPEQYRGLTVRVAGYTAYFVELARDLQDEIIARTEYASI